jgi:prepilin peptidase CpaA
MLVAEAAFVLIVLAAAVSDLVSYRIPNVLVLALIGAFVVWGALHYKETAWLSHFGAALLCLAGGFLLYQFGQMGAGDVKLLTAVALWTGLSGLIPLLLFMSLSGLFALPLILLARGFVARAQASNRWKPEWPVPRVLTKKQGVPYGVAIALGAIVAMVIRPLTIG